MIQLSIREAIEKTNDHRFATGYHLYMYRDGETVFYVGQAANPLSRMLEHLGKDARFGNASPIGRLIVKHEPTSLDWTLQLFTLEECVPFVSEHQPDLYVYYTATLASLERFKEYGATYDKRAVSIAESALIARYQPYLNGQARELPSKYTHAMPDESSGKYLKI